MSGWRYSTLPGCGGYSCEVFHAGAHVATVWQASNITAGAVWCWRIDDRSVRVTRGNRGLAKAAAKRALLRTAAVDTPKKEE